MGRRSFGRLLLLLLAAVLALTGCGTTGGAGGGGGDSSEGLTIWVGSGPTGEATVELGRQFGSEFGIPVTVQVLPGDSLQGNYVTAAQAGEGPDVVLGAHDWIGNLVQNGTIDPVLLSAEVKQSLQPLALRAVTFNGQTYGMPFTMNNIVLFRRTDLVPDAPATFEELVSTGQRLKSEGRVTEVISYPVSQTGNPYFINPLYTSGGGYMFGTTEDGDYNPDDLGVGTPESIQAYEKIGALGERGQGVLKRSIGPDNALSIFTSGKSAFYVSGPWDLPQLAETDLQYDVSAVPPFEGGKPAQPFITADAAYVASGSANKVLAQQFVTDYWARPATQLALFEATQSVPAAKEALAQTAASNPYVSKVAEVGTEFGQIMPSIPQMSAVWDPLGKAQAAVIGGADPAATIQAAGRTIQAAIS